jgi:hypothetical protein
MLKVKYMGTVMKTLNFLKL